MSTTPTNKLLVTNLIEFGLSDKEARIYLSLLESDTSMVQEIAKNAGVNRSSTYVVLESLKRKGLVFSTEGKQKYVAASPETILQQIEDASTKTKAIKEKISGILPDLKALHKETKHKPSVRVFQGKQAIRQIHESALNAPRGSLMRAFSQPSVMENIEEGYFLKLSERRVKKGIHLKAIFPQSIRKWKNIDEVDNKKLLAEFRLLPHETQPLSSDFRIYEDKIALTSLKDEFGIIIESKEIADVVKFIFDLAWKSTEKTKPKNNK